MEPRHISWLSDWDRQVAPDKQRGYIESELRRLHADGEPLLYAALTVPLDSQRDVAISIASQITPIVFLRLVAGAIPPPLDPQGRKTQGDDAGKLVAKTGQVGQMPASQVLSAVESGETARYGAMSRNQAIAPSRQGLYYTVSIGKEPTGVPFDHAVAILRAWGHGVRGEDHRFRERVERTHVPANKDRSDMGMVEARMSFRQDTWLVEEVPQRGNQPIVEKRKAA